MGNKAPRHRFIQPPGGQRPTGDAAAVLDGGEHTRRDIGQAWQGFDGHIVDANHAHDFLDQIGLEGHIGTPAGHLGGEAVALGGQLKTELGQDGSDNHRLDVETGEALDLTEREIDHGIGVDVFARNGRLHRLATTEFEHQTGGQFQTGVGQSRVNMALKAIAGVGNNAGLAAGAGDQIGVPAGAFHEQVDRLVSGTRADAPHDATQAERPLIVSDDGHGLVEGVGLVVERIKALIAGIAQHGLADNLVGVIGVQGAAPAQRDQIGDIDNGVDGAQAHGAQALLQPGRRGAVLDALNIAAAEAANGFGLIGAELVRQRCDRAWSL